MRSDAIFYELFQAAPQTFFELLQITPPCPYHFESITVKSTEKRIDGLLIPEDEAETIYFLEVQAFPDRAIYWRVLREVGTYFEQRDFGYNHEWQAIVLFLEIADDPGFGTLAGLGGGTQPRLVAADLLKLLEQLPEDSLVLNVLQPLITHSESEIRSNVRGWAEQIQKKPHLSWELSQRLVNILAQLITQKFTSLTYKELSKMLRLVPLEETIDGKELIFNERINVLATLIDAKFNLAGATLHETVETLKTFSPETLKRLTREILWLGSVEELENWIERNKTEGEGLQASLN